MNVRTALAALATISLVACSSSSSDSSSSSSSSSSGSSGTSSSSSSSSSSSGSSGSGNACGYEKDCIPSAAPAAAFCSATPNTTPYQCCNPATPAAAAGCTKGSGGSNESATTYCCTGAP